MADSMLNRRSRTIVAQLKSLLEEYAAEQVRRVASKSAGGDSIVGMAFEARGKKKKTAASKTSNECPSFFFPSLTHSYQLNNT